MVNCKECGKEFQPKNKKGVFCSDKCRQKDYRRSMAKLAKMARESLSKDLTKVAKKEMVLVPLSELKLVSTNPTFLTPNSTLTNIKTGKVVKNETKKIVEISDYERKQIEQRIKDIEDELKKPPKNPLIGLRTWTRVRQEELQKLKTELKKAKNKSK